MLLNDIGKSPDKIFKSVNKHLTTNYGISISESTSVKEIGRIIESIEDEIAALKLRGNNSMKSPEISKRLLILEGLKSLKENVIFQSSELEPLITGMVELIVDHFNKCGMHEDDFNDAINHAMVEYRKSVYDFPNDYIESRIRDGAMGILATPGMSSSNSCSSCGEMHGDDAICYGYPIESGNKNITKDTNVVFGESDDEGDGDNLESQTSDNENKAPLVRNKNGKMVVDPFAAQAAARQQGLVMKEQLNLVRNLRMLLETEVSQAEVMRASKGFAQELQEMVEKVGRLQNEDLPPVVDQMRETYGVDSAGAFQTKIYGAFQGVMDALYTAKAQVDSAVSNMAERGAVDADTDMDVPVPDLGIDGSEHDDHELELDNIGDYEEDNFGAEEPLGRHMKSESLKLKQQVLEKQKNDIQELIEKARRIKQASK